MKSGIKSEHWLDANGNPEGGTTFGNGFAIGWQHGPLGRCADECEVGRFDVPDEHAQSCTRREPNGAFVEDIIAAAADRLRFYQSGKFYCDEPGRPNPQHLSQRRMLEAAMQRVEVQGRMIAGMNAVLSAILRKHGPQTLSYAECQPDPRLPVVNRVLNTDGTATFSVEQPTDKETDNAAEKGKEPGNDQS